MGRGCTAKGAIAKMAANNCYNDCVRRCWRKTLLEQYNMHAKNYKYTTEYVYTLTWRQTCKHTLLHINTNSIHIIKHGREAGEKGAGVGREECKCAGVGRERGRRRGRED